MNEIIKKLDNFEMLALKGMGGGGGIESGVEGLSLDAKGKLKELKLYGDTVPNYGFMYNFYNSGVYPLLIKNDKIKRIGDYAFSDASITFDNDFFENVTQIGEFGLACYQNKDTEITIPLWDGRDENGSKADGSIFRKSTNSWLVYNLPKVQYVGDYWWYQNSKNITVQIGSIGYPLIKCAERPFGATSGTGNVTVYTKGELLDTISTAIKNQAGTNYTFVFKASENTTYNGTAYSSGDTMLTISP